MPIIRKPERVTIGSLMQAKSRLKDITTRTYTDEEIKYYDLNESINNHPLARKPTNIRSKLAYAQILKNLKPTTKYLLPGQPVIFHYSEPKYKEELEYYDASPFTIFCGIIRTKENVIREVGINIHYYPPFTRYKVISAIYDHFKPWFDKNFNDITGKPNTWISYDALKGLVHRSAKLGFGVKMYIPTLRGESYVVPTRLLSTACFTEGHFNKATLQNIFHFWRQF